MKNSHFQLNTVPIETYWADSVTIEKCDFANFGLFSGPYSDWYEDSGLRFLSSDDVELTDNTFSAYNPDGLIIFDDVSKVELDNNVFEINSTGLLYEVQAETVGWTSYFSAVDFKECSSVTLVENTFEEDELTDITIPWIYFKDGKGTTCLAANVLSCKSCGLLSV